MTIIKENIDDLNALLKVEIKKADCEENVEKVLRDYRKKANVKGFRPGMVPIGLIRKMYGKAIQLDEINKLVSESIHKYLHDEKLEILGDPLPKADDQELINFDTQEEFTFTFELGLTPQFEIKLSKKNKVNYYQITVDEKMKNDYIGNYTRRFGEFKPSGKSDGKDMLKGNIAELGEQNSIPEEGLKAENTTISIDIIKDEKIKKQFIGKKIDDEIDFDLRKALPNDFEIAGILNKKKEEVKDVNGKFRFTIKEINRFLPAEIGQELFDKVYGEGVINSLDEFMNRVEEEIVTSLKKESDYKAMLDIKKLTIEKTDFSLPEGFLKKWLLKVNEKTTEEQIEKEFESFRSDLKWQLIRNKVARENEIKISEEELQKEAENITRYQFQQYGLFYATDEQIGNYAKDMLKREEEAKRLAEKILEEKAIEKLKEMVKLDDKRITAEDFNKLFE
ncbi:MAG: trigger factor [Odoribacter sp.]|nr:trigger factor [Odoribacter sp.]